MRQMIQKKSELVREFELLNENGKKGVISFLIYIYALAGGVFHSIFVQSQEIKVPLLMQL